MYPVSQLYGEEIITQTVSLVENFQADFGGTEINAPLVSILSSLVLEQNYERHIILLTDGQVSNTDEVVDTITKIREKGIAYVHAIGIGAGFSMDLIKRGAQAGHG